MRSKVVMLQWSKHERTGKKTKEEDNHHDPRMLNATGILLDVTVDGRTGDEKDEIMKIRYSGAWRTEAASLSVNLVVSDKLI